MQASFDLCVLPAFRKNINRWLDLARQNSGIYSALFGLDTSVLQYITESFDINTGIRSRVSNTPSHRICLSVDHPHLSPQSSIICGLFVPLTDQQSS